MTLLDLLSKAAQRYTAAARTLAESARIQSPEFHKLLAQTEFARARVDEARAELEQHLRKHRGD